jgi:hypothetical protein
MQNHDGAFGIRPPKVKIEPYNGSPAGSGPKAFLVKLEQLKISSNVTDRQFLDRYIPPLLEDEALDWFLNHPTWHSWVEFKTELMEQFQLPNADMSIQELLLKRRQNENEGVAEYAEAILNLCRQLMTSPSEQEKIWFIYRNFVEPLKLMMSTHQYHTVRALIAGARRVEAAMVTPDVARTSGITRPRVEAKPSGSAFKDRLCFTCGEAGHLSRACPQRAVKSSTAPESENVRGTPPAPKGGSQ